MGVINFIAKIFHDQPKVTDKFPSQLTSEQVVTSFIERVKEVDPYLNAVVDERFNEAIEEAKAMDRQLQEARQKGTVAELLKDKPLYGIPFTVKESCSLAGEFIFTLFISYLQLV